MLQCSLVILAIGLIAHVLAYSCPAGSYFDKASVSSVATTFLGVEYNVKVLDYHQNSDTTYAGGVVTQGGNNLPFIVSLRTATPL